MKELIKLKDAKDSAEAVIRYYWARRHRRGSESNPVHPQKRADAVGQGCCRSDGRTELQ